MGGWAQSEPEDAVRVQGLIQLQADGASEDRLNLRRLRLSITSRLTDHLDFVVQGHYDDREDKVGLRDLYLRYRVDENLTLHAGQFKTRFGWEGYRSSAETNTIERSDATRALYQERDLGLNIGGANGPWEWDVGVFSGQRLRFEDRNAGKDLVGRLILHLSPETSIGLSGQLGSFVPDGATGGIPVRRAGLLVRHRHDRWSFEGEVLYGDGYNFLSQADTVALGGYLAAVYQLHPKWDGVLHLEAFEPALGLTSENGRLNARSRIVFGVNYYLERDADHRVMLNYELVESWEGPGLPSGVRARYQYRF